MSIEQPSKSESETGSSIKRDFLASIVVFLVALPLCMGIAIASGVPVAAGLITGIVGGLVVGVLAGCPLQVSGPAAGLAVIVFEIVQRFGFEMLGIVVLIAGLIQVVAGVLKLGQWFRAVSPAVIKGMLAGIGVLIFASQFHVMVDDKPKGSGIRNLITIPQAIWKGLSAPEFSGREVRQFRTEMLRTVGELHRRQANLQQRLAKQTQRRVDENNAAPDADVALETIDITVYLPDQARLRDDLNAVVVQLADFQAKHKETSKAVRIREAANLAVAESNAATDALDKNDVERASKLQSQAVASLEALMDRQKNHHLAAYLGVLTIAIIILWQGLAPKNLKVVPGPLIAVVAATLLAATLSVPVLCVEVPNNLWNEVRFPSLNVLSDAPWDSLFKAGLLVAVVASAETLLCATAVDQMNQGPRTRYDRELWAQGVGNTICGILGALPMTGVIVRSTANVQAGGQTRLSAILHGVWLLVFVAGLAFLLRLIPTASLAAILVYTGYKLVNPKSIRELGKYGRGEVAIYAATLGTIVVTDLLTGVLVGIGLAAAKLLYTFSHLAVNLEQEPGSDRATLSLHGAATFVRLPRLASELEKVPARAELHVKFGNLDYIDHACLDLLMNWAKQHESTGGKLVIDWESLRARFAPEKGRVQNGDHESDDRNDSPTDTTVVGRA